MALAGHSHLLSSSSACLRRLNPLLFSAHRRPAWSPRRAARRFCAAVASERDVFTSPEVAKSFDFTSEERIYKWWESQGFFKPNFDRGGDPFVIPMPPPNVTGSLHMGHAMFVTLEDIMIRYFRMKGRPALWVPGTDHAGIATQLVVEKMLAAEGVKRTDLTREEFTKRVWEWKEKYGGTITNQIKRLGASCDWSRERFTLDEQLSRAVVEAFNRLHEKGLIYQGSYLVNWSPNLQTAVSDLEVEYSEEAGSLYFIKYRVAGGSRDDFMTIATTRPETLFGDVAIAVNPEDERYAKYVGRQAIVPLTFGRHVPIIADRYVDPEFGTGVLKISPGHDQNDYHIARKLGLPILNVMNKDGTLNDVAGLYSGMDRFEAREKMWSELVETNLGVKKEPYTLRVPRSQRGGEVIEPLISKQWFVTMEPLAERALHAVEKGQLTILPDRFEKIYNNWLTNIKDWCISRQLWWGHRIPVWYVVGKKCEEDYIVARTEEEALAKAQEKYGKSVEIYQDPDVLDTWFSSALWPFSTLGWPDLSREDFKHFYPATVLETGHDILFFWVARMVMMGIEFTGTVPFSYVYLHGLIRDSEGRKMSKTLGNVIDPLDTIKEYGTDALRFTLCMGTAGQDINLSTERLTSNKAFTNKLWNAGKFVLHNLPDKSDVTAWDLLLANKFDTEASLQKLPLSECWVVTGLHELIDKVSTSYDKFYFGDAAREIYDFFWGHFADWYIEASKTRLYHSGDGSSSNMTQSVLLYVFENILKLLHPFMPFVTEELWQALPYRKHALIVAPWPTTDLPKNLRSIKRFQNLQSLIRGIRNVRAEYSVEPAKQISASVVAGADVLEYISKEKQVLALLSKLDVENVRFTESPPGDANQSVHIVADEGLEAYLPLADMVDVSEEVKRLSKRLSKMQAEYDALLGRLNSPSFVEKAPEDIVRGVREKASEAEEKISLTMNRLSFLQSTVSSFHSSPHSPWPPPSSASRSRRALLHLSALRLPLSTQPCHEPPSSSNRCLPAFLSFLAAATAGSTVALCDSGGLDHRVGGKDSTELVVRGEHKPLLREFIDELASFLGENLTVDLEERSFRGKPQNSFHKAVNVPDVVVFPRSQDDVQKIVMTCNKYKVPIVPYGGATSIEGHTLAPHGGVYVDMTLMKNIKSLHVEDMDVVVEPGVGWIELNEYLKPYGLFFPLDPGPGATIGGMCATCCSGSLAVRYGTMRDNVINLQAVLPNGDVIKTGSRARKSAAGYDLARLIIGSEGTLGVITEVTLRLQKLPSHSVVAMCNFQTVKDAADVAIATMLSGIQVSRVELLDEVQIRAINMANGKSLPEIPTLMFEFIGTEAYALEQTLLVQKIAAKHHGSDFVFVEEANAKEELWKIRKEALWAGFAMKPDHEAMITDVCVPLSRLAECISVSKKLLDASPLTCLVIAHAGDGNFHTIILFDPSQEDQRQEAERLNHFMVHTALDMEGTCTGEHGVGTGKMKYLEKELGMESLRTMKRIKAALDPNNIMNPGKLIPPHVCI